MGCAGSQTCNAAGSPKRPLDAKVGDEPRRLEVEVVHIDTERPTDEAVATVTANDVTATEANSVAVRFDGRYGRTVWHVVVEGDDPTPAEQINVVKARAKSVEHVFEVWLIHHVPLGPAAAALLVEVVLHEQIAGGVLPFVGRLDKRAFCDLRRLSQLLKGPHDLVIECRGARLVVEPRVCLDDRHAMPGLAEKRAKHHAGRAVADDDDIVGRLLRQRVRHVRSAPAVVVRLDGSVDGLSERSRSAFVRPIFCRSSSLIGALSNHGAASSWLSNG